MNMLKRQESVNLLALCVFLLSLFHDIGAPHVPGMFRSQQHLDRKARQRQDAINRPIEERARLVEADIESKLILIMDYKHADYEIMPYLKTREAAINHCLSRGGWLATPRNEAENVHLKSIILEKIFPDIFGSPPEWIAANIHKARFPHKHPPASDYRNQVITGLHRDYTQTGSDAVKYLNTWSDFSHLIGRGLEDQEWRRETAIGETFPVTDITWGGPDGQNKNGVSKGLSYGNNCASYQYNHIEEPKPDVEGNIWEYRRASFAGKPDTYANLIAVECGRGRSNNDEYNYICAYDKHTQAGRGSARNAVHYDK